MAISMRTIGALVKPFAGGGGPSHAEIAVVFASADADEYLPTEGNKQTRVLTGLRVLKNGRRLAPGTRSLPRDGGKLAEVAEQLASLLVARDLLSYDDVREALEEPPISATAPVAAATKAHRTEQDTATLDDGPAPDDPRIVMVVHGQDEQARKAMFAWLRSVGLKPREWTQLVADTNTASPYIGDVIDEAFERAAAVVVLFTPDEHVRLRSGLARGARNWRLQARPNVMFEAGAALARHPRRTILVVLGEQELPSDLAGRHYVRLGNVRALRDLSARLRKAGCPVDESGDDWLDVSQFPDRSIDPGPPSR